MFQYLLSVLEYLGIFLVVYMVFVKIYCKLTIGFYEGKERLDDKTIIVTGANSGEPRFTLKKSLSNAQPGKYLNVILGIGLECARDLAHRGARVIMACRDMEKGEKVRKHLVEESGNSNIVLKYVDFSSLSSVRECANQLLKEELRIDVLLNNAGTCALGLQNFTADGLEKLLQTNHFGPFLFTNILLGRIKESAPSRIVNVSSVMHWFARLDLNRLDQRHIASETMLYANSKLANIYFTTALASKLKGSGVTVNCLHPGVVRSDMARNTPKYFQWIWDTTMKIFFKTQREGAQTSIFLCVSPKVNNTTGKYFSDCKECRTSNKAQDFGLANKLWELSEKLVSLQDHERHY